jgi:hypothetical protein
MSDWEGGGHESDDENMVTVSEEETTLIPDVTNEGEFIEVKKKVKKKRKRQDIDHEETVQSEIVINRKYDILYSDKNEAPFQVMVESPEGGKAIARTDLRWINKTFKPYINDGDSISIKNKYQIVFEFSTADKANNFLRNADLTGLGAKAYIPPSFVEIIGIIRNVAEGISDSELIINMKCSDGKTKINHVRRFKKRESNGELTELNTVAVHFQSKYLPVGVYLFDSMYFRVSQYNKKPIRCNKCSRLGHIEMFCSNTKVVCTYCSGDHKTETCEKKSAKSSPLCALCKGEHEATSKDCLKYKLASKAMKQNPFPKLYNRTSIKSNPTPKRTPPLFNGKEFPQLTNKYSALTTDEEGEDSQTSTSLSWFRRPPQKSPITKPKHHSTRIIKPASLKRAVQFSQDDLDYYNKSHPTPSTSQATGETNASENKRFRGKPSAAPKTTSQQPTLGNSMHDFIANTITNLIKTSLQELIKTIISSIPNIIAEAMKQTNISSEIHHGSS